MKTCLTLAILALCMVGCSGGNDMSQAEIDSIKASKPPTDADRQKIANGMAAGAAASQSAQAAWAKAHPEEAAKINAERAQMGRPPLGG